MVLPCCPVALLPCCLRLAWSVPFSEKQRRAVNWASIGFSQGLYVEVWATSTLLAAAQSPTRVSFFVVGCREKASSTFATRILGERGLGGSSALGTGGLQRAGQAVSARVRRQRQRDATAVSASEFTAPLSPPSPRRHA